jgi:diadenosine tetraphosphatase ApaH/serine/threonine PP2A family protein phosphatase
VRYAVLADVHGNLEALRAVLADAAHRADGILCLGDVVGCGADPDACVELVAERCLVVLGGDHDLGTAGRLDAARFAEAERVALHWTRQRLNADARAWLAARPGTCEIGDATMAHAAGPPEEWLEPPMDAAEDGFAALAAVPTRLGFVGHSHRPALWASGSWGRDHEDGPAEVTLGIGSRYLVDVGSVGQPRDGDARAAYALWDAPGRRISIRRVSYDVAAAADKIVAAGLPPFLADRLAAGR